MGTSHVVVMAPIAIVRPLTAKIDRGVRPGDSVIFDGQAVQKIKLFFRAAVDLVERSRMARAALAGVRASARSFGRVLHQLWLEVTGFTFLAMAAVGALADIREYGRYQAGHTSGPGRLLLAICFTLSFAWFGLSSFWRVNKRVSKQRN